MSKRLKTHNIVKKVAITLALPLITFIIMDLLAWIIKDTHIIRTALDVKNMVRGAGIAAAIAFALSMNLTSGRMDLSLGSQRVISTIFGGVLAAQLGLGGIWVLVFAILFGTLFGGLVGLAYVTLRIPPMVLGIGMACIYESLAFALTDGVGLRLVGMPGADILADVNFTIVVIGIVTIALLVLMTYTKFSYNFRAVRGNQTIAKNAGINIFVNVAICYTLAGLIISISGVLDAAFSGSMAPAMGLTSNGSVMRNMFAMMIGCSLLSKYINQSVGIISASVALKIFSMGLTAFNISDAMNNCINMAIFIVFLVYLANSNVIARYKYDKRRIAMAQEMKKKRMSEQ